jgi:integrase/recombinase XerC
MSWTETLERFLKTGDRTVTTLDQYQRALGEFATWHRDTHGTDPDPKTLTGEDAQEWRDHLSDPDGRSLATATVNMRLSALRQLCRFCDNDISVRSLHVERKPIEVLGERDLESLFRAVEGGGWMNKRNIAMLAVMARAGLRDSEVAALDVDDVVIEEEAGWVTVRGESKEREIPLSSAAREALASYLEVRPEGDTQALFLSRNEKRLHAVDVDRMLDAAGRRAEVEGVTPFVLRHTFAVRFLEKTGESGLRALRAILGHERLATTARYLPPDGAPTVGMVEDL